MECDAIWQAFSETGDPLYYLLYKQTLHAKPGGEKQEESTRPGELPRPAD